MKGFIMGFVSALCMTTVAVSAVIQAIRADLPNLYPTTDLSAVRLIYCHNPQVKNMGWEGSGSIVGKDLILTAKHVASGNDCVDEMTGKSLKMVDYDDAHDIAFMSGDLPDVSPIKMSCQPYKKNETYLAYGISNYMNKNYLFRMNKMVAKDIEDTHLADGTPIKHIRAMYGAIVPGMSGGPIVDIDGYAHGVVNIGDHDIVGIPTKDSDSYQLADSKFCK